MPLNSVNIPNASSDVVGVFDADFNQLFPLANPMKASIKELSQAMRHPVEDGSVITDNRIILPTEIEMVIILPSRIYRSVYQQIKQIFISAPFLSIQTRATTYTQMLLEKMPHEEDPDKFTTITMTLGFVKVQLVKASAQILPAAAVREPADQSTVQLGEQQTAVDSVLLPPVTIANPSTVEKGDALPQSPPPPNRSIIVAPRQPPASPINNDQYDQIYEGTNFSGVGR